MTAAAALALASAAIVSAFVIQWIGFEPCVLCLRQRIPYYVGIPVLAAAVIASPSAGRLNSLARPLAVIAVVCFVISAVLGINHAGVEQGLWEGPATCVTRTLDTSSLEAFAAQIGATKMVSCNTPSFTLLGFSLAWWNLAVSAGITCILSYGILIGGRRGR
jgi:disulfide bond formation protein DsbB